jgi:hypothetical protein
LQGVQEQQLNEFAKIIQSISKYIGIIEAKLNVGIKLLENVEAIGK